MSAVLQPAIQPAAAREFLSGNEAVARGALDAGVELAAAYPGTPSTEIVETLATFPGVYAEWSTNEKVGPRSGARCLDDRAARHHRDEARGAECRLRLADDAGTGRRQGRSRDRRVRRRRLLLLAERAGLSLLGPVRASARARALRRERSLRHDARRVRPLGALRGARAAAPDDAHFARETHGANVGARVARRRTPRLREGRGTLDHHAEPRRQAAGTARRARQRARTRGGVLRLEPAGTRNRAPARLHRFRARLSRRARGLSGRADPEAGPVAPAADRPREAPCRQRRPGARRRGGRSHRRERTPRRGPGRPRQGCPAARGRNHRSGPEASRGTSHRRRVRRQRRNSRGARVSAPADTVRRLPVHRGLFLAGAAEGHHHLRRHRLLHAGLRVALGRHGHVHLDGCVARRRPWHGEGAGRRREPQVGACRHRRLHVPAHRNARTGEHRLSGRQRDGAAAGQPFDGDDGRPEQSWQRPQAGRHARAEHRFRTARRGPGREARTHPHDRSVRAPDLLQGPARRDEGARTFGHHHHPTLRVHARIRTPPAAQGH